MTKSIIDIRVEGDKVRINDYMFEQENFNRIRTRIERNTFKGEYSHIRGMSGTTVVREDNNIILGKPKEVPKQSWSYQEWVRQSDGWTVYARGTYDEWINAFKQVEV